MARARVFLGWDGPVLPRAADWLLGTRGMDLGGHLVVVPGGRAGRLLSATLVERMLSGARGGPLSPPSIVTPRDLGAAIYHFSSPPAGVVSTRLAWVAAIHELGFQGLRALFTHPPDAGDTPGLARVAALLEEWTREVAASGRRLGQVAAVGEEVPDFADGERWSVAGLLQERYERVLAQQGLHDPELATLDAVLDPGRVTRRAWRIVLLGVAELTPLARMALRECEDVVSLVAAPEDEAERFDEWGCVRPERWSGHPDLPAIPIGDDRVLFADGPEDQASLALAAMASLGGAYSAEEIIVGTPDEEVAPRLITAGRRVGPGAADATGRGGGIEFRSAAGRPLMQTPVASLLVAIRDYITACSFESLAALVRHPDVERWLALRLGPPAAGRPCEHWLSLLDQYAAQGLPDSAAGPWRIAHPGHRRVLEAVRDAVDEWLGPLLGLSTLSPARHPGAWGRDLLGVLARLYEDRRFTRTNPVSEMVVAACDRVREVALDLARGPGGGPRTAMPACDALTLILQALRDESLPLPPSREAVEMLGWMELALDPAPVAIVTGLNEGKVPVHPAATPMLPERLREALGLATGAARLARDAYLLTLLVRSRPHVWLIAGRRGAEGDPLQPSRLLFLGDDAAAVARLRMFTGLDRCGRVAPVRRRAMGVKGRAAPAMPLMPEGSEGPGGLAGQIPTSLPVTAFRLFLASPYEFYLRQVARVRSVEGPEPELSPLLFGSLIHEVMATLPGHDAAASDDPRRVEQALSDLLSTLAAQRLGPRPRTSVALQVEIARDRLRLLAQHQAAWAGEGWRILATERRIDRGGASLDVDGVPMGLHGAIDRIDRHEDGRLAVLDYKCGEKPTDPEKAHRAGRGGEKHWVDLQLPLYRHLVAAVLESDAAVRAGVREPVEVSLGYVRLGAGPEHIGMSMATWSSVELDEADEKARDVVRAIRRGEFKKPGRHSSERIVTALCGGAGGGGGS